MAIDFEKIRKAAVLKDQTAKAAGLEAKTAYKPMVNGVALEQNHSGATMTGGGIVGNALKGAAKSTASGWVNTGGTLLDLMNRVSAKASSENRKASQEADNAARYREMLASGRMADGTPIDAAKRAQLEMLVQRAEDTSRVYAEGNENIHSHGAEAAQGLYKTADKLAAESEKHITAAKKNTGTVGDFLVDLGVAGTQLVGDRLTGGLVATGIRTFGSGAQEARQNGATLGQQVGYGAGSAAVGVLTEKLANVAGPFKKAFGKGFFDDVLAKVAAKPAGMLAISALSEGFEESAEAVVQPILQRMTYDNNDSAIVYDADWVADTLYSMAIGGVLGGAGGGIDVAMSGRGQNLAPRRSGETQIAQNEGNNAPAQKAGAQDLSGDIMTAEAQQLFGQNKTVSPNRGETAEVVKVLSDSIPVLQERQPVSTTSSQVFRTVEGNTMAEKARKLFENIKGVVTRQGLGDVEINGRSVKDDLSHGVGPAKAATISVIPQVIQHGEQIDFQQNWKGRGYDGYTFAAPVVMDGEVVYVAAVVKRTNKNRFYLHEVVDSKGNIIKIDDGESANPTSLATNGDAGTQTPSSTSDYTVTHKSETVNVENMDPLLRLMLGGKRVDQSKASDEQFAALADRGDIGVDAAGKLFQIDPAQHIDRRSMDTVGSRKVNAFQFDHPQLHSYYQQAARALIADADISLQFGLQRNPERTVQGKKMRQQAQTSQHLRRAMDETGLSRSEIIDAAQRIVNDKGQENVKAAKQVEIILDDMLTNGWQPMMGEAVVPNEAYIAAKNEIAGSQPVKESGHGLDGVGAANAGSLNSDYENLQAQSDSFHPEGAYAARPVDVPTQNFDGSNIPRGASNIMGGQALDEHDVRFLEQQIADGKLAFDTIKDKDSVSRAQTTMAEKGFDGALEQYRQAVNSGVATKDNTTLGQQLLLTAMREGNVRYTAELLSLYTRNSTNAAQALQAQSIFRKLSPEGQLVAMQKAVDALNEKYGTKVEIDEADVADFMEAETDEARQEVEKRIVQKAAKAVPGTFKGKFDTIRYLAMLGNPRTHIRNILGNTLFQVPVAVKNRVGAAAEIVAGAVSRGKTDRTKSLFGVNPFGKLAAEARADWVNVKDFLSQNSAYAEGKASLSAIEQEAHAFSDENLLGRGVNALADVNSKALEAEDMAAKKLIYAQSLAGYLKANGCKSMADVDPALLNKARVYAADEALRNTFNDKNAVSSAVSMLGLASKSKNPALRTAGYVVEGALPFKRTPANILVRAAEYSPVGAALGTLDTIRGARSGDMEAVSRGLDRLAAGVTGIVLMKLGALAAGNGWVRGQEDEDDEQAAFDNLTGHQAYALELKNGTSVTLDWLAPEAIPFFMGVELYNAALDANLSIGELGDTLKNATAPMLELSMLQGLNDIFDNAAYAKYSGGSVMGSIVTSALSSYVTQVFPTIGGQLERSTEDVRMTTYTEKDGELPTDLQYTLGKVSQKIPGLDYQQIPYIDAWGREEATGDPLERAANNLFNPAYMSQIDVDKVERELQRLKDVVTDEDELTFFPTRAEKSFEVDGETKNLTAEQYVKYAKEKGQNSYKLVQSAIISPDYKAMSDREKAEFVTKMYGYANYKAKKALFPGYESTAYQKYAAAENVGMAPTEYYVMRQTYDYDGSSQSGQPTQAEAQRYLDTETALNRNQKADMWTIINKSWKKNPYA